MFITGDELAADDLMAHLFACKSKQLLTANLKSQLPYLKWINEQRAAEDWEAYCTQRNRFFERTVAAYLLNPLKGEYPCDDIAKDYLGLMVPGKADLLGKKTVAEVLAEDEKKAVPEPSSISSVLTEGNQFKTLVDVDFDNYRKRNENRSVRKNCTIPSWLNDEAEKAGINFSATLQEALKAQLGL